MISHENHLLTPRHIAFDRDKCFQDKDIALEIRISSFHNNACDKAVYYRGWRTQRSALRRCIIVILMVLVFVRLPAEAAQPISAKSYTGDCIWEDSNNSNETSNESKCDKTVNELIYDDGYTSIDFRSPMYDGSGLAHILFIGIRWHRLDEFRQSMVLDQVIFSYPKKKTKASKDSGFCIITSKLNSSDVESVRCESLTGKESHIFSLSAISSQEGPH